MKDYTLRINSTPVPEAEAITQLDNIVQWEGSNLQVIPQQSQTLALELIEAIASQVDEGSGLKLRDSFKAVVKVLTHYTAISPEILEKAGLCSVGGKLETKILSNEQIADYVQEKKWFKEEIRSEKLSELLAFLSDAPIVMKTEYGLEFLSWTFSTLRELSPNEKREFFAYAPRLFEKVKEPIEASFLFSKIMKAPAGERSEVVSCLLELSANGEFEIEIGESLAILEDIIRLQSSIRTAVVSLTSTLISKDSRCLEICKIMIALSKIEPSSQEDVVKWVSRLLNRPTLTGRWCLLPEVIAIMDSISSERRVDVVLCMECLLLSDSDNFYLDIILKWVASMKLQDTDDLRSRMRNLVTLQLSLEDRVEFMEALGSRAASERDELLKRAKDLRNEGADFRNKDLVDHAFIRCSVVLSRIPRSKVEYCLSTIQSPSLKCNNIYRTLEILAALGKMDKETSPGLLKAACGILGTINDAADEYKLVATLNLLRLLPEKEHSESLFQIIDDLVKCDRAVFGLEKVVKSFEAVLVEERADLLKQIVQSLPKPYSLEHVANIIDISILIPKDARAKNVVDSISSLLKHLDAFSVKYVIEQTGINERPGLLVQMASISRSLFAAENPLAPRQVLWILELLSLIPVVDQSENVVQNLVYTVTNYQDLGVIRILKQRIHGIPPEERGAVFHTPESALRFLRDTIIIGMGRTEFPLMEFPLQVKQIDETPAAVVRDLATFLLTQRPDHYQLYLKFLDENNQPLPGLDIGGLSRQLYGELFRAIAQKHVANFDPHGHFLVPRMTSSSQETEDSELFMNMGVVMNFCLNATLHGRHYLIGEVFGPEFFSALATFTEDELQEGFMFDMEHDLTRLKEIDSKLSLQEEKRPFTQGLPSLEEKNPLKFAQCAIPYMNLLGLPLPEALIAFQEKTSFEDFETLTSDEQSLIMSNHWALRGILQEIELDNFRATNLRRLQAIHLIAKGIYRVSDFCVSWKEIKAMDVGDLRKKVQGVEPTAREIIARLKCEGISEPHKNFLKQWISEASADQHRNFLKAVSGSPSLGTWNILVSHTGGTMFNFRTCAFQLDVPQISFESYDTFKALLETSIEYGLAGGGVQFE